MIQRIQSFWLVLAACCMALCFLTPVAEYHMTIPNTLQQAEGCLNLIAKDNPQMMQQMLDTSQTLEYSQKMSGFHSWPLIVLAVLVAAISLISIFLYSNRIKQMRVVAVAFLLNVIYVFLIFFWAVDAYAKTMTQALGGEDLKTTWFVGAYAPIISIALLVLAHRAIKRDENKVRAADRLR